MPKHLLLPALLLLLISCQPVERPDTLDTQPVPAAPARHAYCPAASDTVWSDFAVGATTRRCWRAVGVSESGPQEVGCPDDYTSIDTTAGAWPAYCR